MATPIVKWELTSWGNSPIRREFTRETPSMYFYLERNGEERRESKISRYASRYFDTEEQALKAVQAREDAKAARDRAARIRDAAPELLAALRMFYKAGFGNSTDFNAQAAAFSAADAAIAKATGE